ncbi:hypothetical protein HJC99_05650 [Candidatus Saccharibacteria bacterium]|nr:hypothetical protein [Candidatus Saccharibacteria bacterium]
MSELADFSIETETTVLLVYNDGTRLRVPTRRLSKYLDGVELTRVRHALKLRREFWRQHLPKGSLAVGLAAALLAIGMAGTTKLAHQNAKPTSPAPAPTSLAAAKLLPTPVTATTPASVSGEVAGAATAAPQAPSRAARPGSSPTPPVTALPKPRSEMSRTIEEVTAPIVDLIK